MTIEERVRGILWDVFCGYECADSALTAILTAVREGLPEDKISCNRKLSSCGKCHDCIKDAGFNQALTEVRKALGGE